jgi:hypothetical protein
MSAEHCCKVFGKLIQLIADKAQASTPTTIAS